ncbi:piwi-like protein Ago3 [Vespa mandarinia]|uniref:piwi-like protein Ago3 n=1 Tax=Vespa mandarinia TaxID=7446 RepID=UPI001618E692|nr:piwi-like protein Ago3 [Vespa mandarinia]XP_035744236.1 piwi-like protein Ago3 [Vespa mandarinia]XP_035744237.1 piwi-like protein Ago3 [Vespa mandarinia]
MTDKCDAGPSKLGIGRGTLVLQKIRKQLVENESKILDKSSFTYQQQSISQLQAFNTTLPFMGRGKALLLNFTKTEKEKEKSPFFELLPTIGKGRASPLSLFKKTTTSGQPLMIEQETSTGESFIEKQQSNVRQPVIVQEKIASSNNNAGILDKLSQLSIYETTPATATPSEELQVINRQGTSGKVVDLFANYIDLKLDTGRGLFQYEVKFNPDIDSRALRRKLLNQHAAKLGYTLSFDGVLLYLPQKFPQENIVYKSDHPLDGSPVILTLIFKKKEKMSESIQFFNILFGRIMRALNFVRIGRQNFNPACAHTVPQHQLEIWPGYITAINEYEGGLKLCIDAKHRVMRMETVRDLIIEFHEKNQEHYKDYITMEVVGSSVLTRYNNKTYRIDDIAWDKNPMFEFERQGMKTTMIDYYKNHWSLEIKDKNQPLLVHRSNEKLPTGQTHEKLTLLVPELCYIAGLTDSIRSDCKIMKDLNTITKVSPNNRRDIIRNFLHEIKKNSVTQEILSAWGLHIDDDLTHLKGRVLMPEHIYFGKNKMIQGKSNAEWHIEMINNHALRAPNLKNWYIFYSQRDTKYATAFIKTLLNISLNLGLQISIPHEVSLKDDRTDTYLRKLRYIINDDVEMVVIVFPTNRTDRYSAVKKFCCVEKPIPSQVIMSRSLSRPDKLRSITQKIALQMNCKLGGALWAVNIPFDKCMVCGIDVYHPGLGEGRRGSVAGFVASMDKLLTSWYSKICLQGAHQEIIDLLQICLISAINAFKKHNGSNPNRIIVYRDGVGDGQIDTIAKYEVKQLLATFTHIDPDYKPQLSVIVVQKRINTRLFCENQGNLINPASGTIIDFSITRPNFYDFFLIPQSIRAGTVTPTHYIVAYDGSNMKPDHIQRFTYKLCHLYYNWPGTIRVPAPCQYAHKLVSLVGQNIQMEPDLSLCNYLFYL